MAQTDKLIQAAMLDRALSDNAFRTYLVYLMHADPQDGKCYLSGEEVAHLENRTVGTISHHNRELEILGYIRRERRMGLPSVTEILDYMGESK